MNNANILNGAKEMKSKNTNHFSDTSRILWVGISIALIFWIVESIIHVYIFDKGNLISHIFTLDLHEIWMRLLVSSILIIFSVYMQRVSKKIKLVNEELNQIFNTTAVGMCVIDKDFNVTRINKTFSLLSGVSEAEAIGEKCYDVFHGPMCNTPSCPLTRIMGGIKRIECDVKKERRDGIIIPCMLTVIPFRGLNGKIIGIVEDFRDITERKRANEALRESEEHLRTLQDNVPIGIFRSTPKGKIISVNPAFITMFGYDSEEELMAIPAVDLYLVSKQREKLLYLLVKKGKATNFEVHLKRKDGSTFWGSLNIKAITNEEGKIMYQDGILEDITKRKQSAEAIHQAKQEWERIFDSFPDLITILDKKHTILRVNKAMADRLGTIPEKVIGQTCYKISHGTNKPPTHCAYVKMLKDGQVYTEVIHEKHLCGDFLVTVSPLYDPNGRLIGAIHAARDITGHKRMEEELKKAQRLESLGLLAGGIAHDFNNIISGILVNIGVAKIETKKEESVIRRLIEVENALSRARNLIQQLLTFSKGGEPTKTLSSISRLIRDTAGFILSGSNIKCTFTLPDNLWAIKINEGHISQVIQNLVINAMQAMPEGGVIHIQAENVSIKASKELPLKRGRYVKISVKDPGIGIPQSYMNKIFDPFFTTKQKGSGLGLSTAYSIIKNHNGLITAESELGKGTTFYIFLPASLEKTKKKGKQTQEMAAGKGKILFMDDDDIVLNVTKELLRGIGYTVELAKDGEEAIKRYKKALQSGQSFDVVILDLIVRGGLGGLETLRELQKIDPKVKAIVSSGYSTDPVIANYKEYGFVNSIAKPYKAEKLSIIIQEAIKGSNDNNMEDSV
jgi:PAS domain S-box-containing protein